MQLLQSKLDIDDFIFKMIQMPLAEIGLNQLQEWIARLKLNDEWLSSYIGFNNQTYQRQRLYRTSEFELLLLCWLPGQTSTIHDHANSFNITRVYQGVLTARTFKDSPSFSEKPTLTSEKHLQKDDLDAVNPYSIHQLANTSRQNLITLHLYTKPLKNIRIYCPIP